MMFLKDKLTIEDVIKEKQEIIQEDIRLREEIEKMIQILCDLFFFDFLYFDKFYMSYNYYNNSPFTYFEIMKLASFTTDLKTLNILLRHKNIQLLDIAIDILE